MFNEVDAYLCAGLLQIPSKLVNGGVGAAWNNRSLTEYSVLNAEPLEEVDCYIEYWHAKQDRPIIGITERFVHNDATSWRT